MSGSPIMAEDEYARTEDARREYEAALLFDPGHGKARLNLLFLKP